MRYVMISYIKEIIEVKLSKYLKKRYKLLINIEIMGYTNILRQEEKERIGQIKLKYYGIL
jgi:hypothetical protein